MDVDQLIGSTGIRAATLAVLLLAVTVVVFREQTTLSGTRDVLFFLAIGGGVLTFIGLIHSFRSLYSRWLILAEHVQKLVVTLLFGSCYLLIVPWFFLIGRVISLLRLRSRSEPESFWISRRRADCDARSLARMG